VVEESGGELRVERAKALEVALFQTFNSQQSTLNFSRKKRDREQRGD
jgi:hypothetical protein